MARWLAHARFIIGALALASAVAAPQTFKPGEPWLDNRGQHIQAHGGGVVRHGDTWYWFGEDRSRSSAHDTLKRICSRPVHMRMCVLRLSALAMVRHRLQHFSIHHIDRRALCVGGDLIEDLGKLDFVFLARDVANVRRADDVVHAEQRVVGVT